MEQTAEISLEHVALRSADQSLISWLSNVGIALPQTEFHPSTLVAIYGNDYAEYLPADNHNDCLERCHAALCLASEETFSFLEMLRHKVRHIIYRNAPFAIEAMKLALLAANNQLTTCGGFLEFNQTPQVLDRFECNILSSDDTSRLWKCTSDFFQKHGISETTMQSVNLALKEAVTNATFHAFREAGTHSRKYMPETFHGLYDNDCVKVTFTLTGDWLSVRVWDNGGSLGPLSVANSLDRHQSNLGLMDTRGRGFYLMRHLSDRMVVCIHRRQETSVKMYFLRKSDHKTPKHFELIDL